MRASIQSRSFLGLLALLMPLGGHSVDYASLDYHGPYFVLRHGKTLVNERLDPVMSPGANPSNHVHNIFGANTFAPNFDYDKAQKATCNTHGVKIDHSNYWYPALYFHDKAKDTYEMAPTDLWTYYHFDPTSAGARKAFPKGFKMISGSAMNRHNDTATNVATRSVRWYCHGSPDNIALGGFDSGFSECNGPDGFSSEIWFPFCHNGEEFNPADPMAHMAFGEVGGTPTETGGDCPSTHPTALPQLFMEFHHDTSKFSWTADEQPWVLAQGDPTGFGMHADFVNGWEDGLQNAININAATGKTNCEIGESGDPLSSCFELYDDATVSSCSIPGVVQGDPDVLSPGSSLPGCNPLQTGPADATIQTGCAGYKAPSSVAGGSPTETAAASSVPAASQPSSMPSGNGADSGNDSPAPDKQAITSPASSTSSPAESSTTSSSNSGTGSTSGGNAIPSTVTVSGTTWTYQGCYSDLVPNRSIRTLGNWGRGQTPQDCAINCAAGGYKISGVEYGSQCFCDNKIDHAQAKKLDDSECNMSCMGSSQTCGGNGALQIYAAQGTSLGKRRHKKRHVTRHIRDFGKGE